MGVMRVFEIRKDIHALALMHPARNKCRHACASNGAKKKNVIQHRIRLLEQSRLANNGSSNRSDGPLLRNGHSGHSAASCTLACIFPATFVARTVSLATRSCFALSPRTRQGRNGHGYQSVSCQQPAKRWHRRIRRGSDTAVCGVPIRFDCQRNTAIEERLRSRGVSQSRLNLKRKTVETGK